MLLAACPTDDHRHNGVGMFGNLGMTELLMIMVICLVLFGAKRIPEMAGSIGKGIREFKRSISSVDELATSAGGGAIRRPVADDPPVEEERAEPKRLVG
jgi:sec-independent protein translocase protein TatA